MAEMTDTQVACLRLFAYALGQDDRVTVQTRVTAKALHQALSDQDNKREGGT